MRMLSNMTESPGGLFLLGAVGAVLLGPTLGQVARPVVKTAARGVFRLSQGAQMAAFGVAQEWNNLLAEAREEMVARNATELGHA